MRCVGSGSVLCMLWGYYRSEDMHQKLARRVRFISIEPLRRGNEPYSKACQFLNTGYTVDEERPKRSSFHTTTASNLRCRSVFHQSIESRAGDSSAAQLVLVRLNQSPTTAFNVMLQFADLDSIGLVGRRYASVYGGIHSGVPST